MDKADIAIIGAGAASAVTLIDLFKRLLEGAPTTKKLSIAVIEKKPELWRGVPYGPRSSVNALTITNVYEFIYEKERAPFFEWLKANKHKWASWYRERGGQTAARWLETNLPRIDNNDWEAVFIPRFLFGNYLDEKLTGLKKEVEEKQLADVTTIHAEATDVTITSGSQYEVVLEHPDGTLSTLTARKLVIAIGSVPVRKICDIKTNDVVYINDIYEPSVSENIQMLRQKLDGARDNNVLIVGSNAASIEWLYLLEGLPEMRKLIKETVVMSTSGILPHHISTEVLADHPTPNLDALKEGNYTIQTLTEAAGRDMKLALQNGANMDYVATIVGSVLKLLEVLGEEGKKQFYCIYGLMLRDMFRRSGPEYKGGSQALIDGGEAALVKGRFINAEPSENGVAVSYLDTVTGQQKTYPLIFNAIINCTGSTDAQVSSSRLLRNLVSKNICEVNLSGKGFEVNEKFEARPNLYIMGPMLAGNVNERIHFWQLENAGRLTSLAPYLVTELLGDL